MLELQKISQRVEEDALKEKQSVISLPGYLAIFPDVLKAVMGQNKPLKDSTFGTLLLHPIQYHLPDMDLDTVQELGSTLNAQIVVGRDRQDSHKPELIAQIVTIHNMLKDREEQLLQTKRQG